GVLDPSIRRHLCDDRRRPGRLHHSSHSVRVALRLPVRGDGLCGRTRPGPCRDRACLHPATAASLQASRALPMSTTLPSEEPTATSTSTRASRSRAPTAPRRWLLVAALTALALLMIFPLYWMVVSALTPGGQSQSSEFYLWPSAPTFAN